MFHENTRDWVEALDATGGLPLSDMPILVAAELIGAGAAHVLNGILALTIDDLEDSSTGISPSLN